MIYTLNSDYREWVRAGLKGKTAISRGEAEWVKPGDILDLTKGYIRGKSSVSWCPFCGRDTENEELYHYEDEEGRDNLICSVCFLAQTGWKLSLY